MHYVIVALVAALSGGVAVYLFRNKLAADVAAAEAKAKSAAEDFVADIKEKL